MQGPFLKPGVLHYEDFISPEIISSILELISFTVKLVSFGGD